MGFLIADVDTDNQSADQYTTDITYKSDKLSEKEKLHC